MIDLLYREVWAVDFEYIADRGERPIPICLVARELRSARLIRLRSVEFGPEPPYPTDPGVLFVAYYASAELGCHLVLGWPMPARVLDLYVEFRRFSNGLPVPCGRGLDGALTAHGLDSMAADEKQDMRNLILRGGPWSNSEQLAILDYCQADVDALARLLPRMWPQIAPDGRALGQALLRGRYTSAVARIEHAGVPIDLYTLERLRGGWSAIKTALVAEVDQDFEVYDGTVFKADRFAAYLAREGIPWPRHESGLPGIFCSCLL